jgi:NAD(P)-dependent dehydrogenase (short-subunit alcohol dehydrogenase family)
MEEIEGKVAFVTGGASGIGLGIAQAFVGAGMKVVLADVRQDHIDEATASLAESGGSDSVHAIQLDVTDREAFARAADEAERVFGNVHVLVNNAGVSVLGPVKLARYGDWDWALGVMIGGVVNGIQTFLPRILAHGEGGHIVNTSSMAAVVPIPGASIYITAKAALIGLSESIRGELAANGIGVSAFCPGPVQTNIRESGKMRPEQYRHDTGYAKLERELEQRPNSPLWMDAAECGERVLRGIRRNDLYIFTHREFREGADERFRAMLASFPDEPLNTERADEIRFLLSNEIFREALD